jgi:hypothetical protein
MAGKVFFSVTIVAVRHRDPPVRPRGPRPPRAAPGPHGRVVPGDPPDPHRRETLARVPADTPANTPARTNAHKRWRCLLHRDAEGRARADRRPAFVPATMNAVSAARNSLCSAFARRSFHRRSTSSGVGRSFVLDANEVAAEQQLVELECQEENVGGKTVTSERPCSRNSAGVADRSSRVAARR